MKSSAPTTAPHRLFGRISDRGGSRESGVVLVHPIGEEKKLWQRPLATLARALDAQGIPNVLFDLSGCGESEGTNVDLDTWVADINHCGGELIAESAVRRVVFVGARLGAALALLASRRFPGAHQLWIDPVLDVEGSLRKLIGRRTMHRLLYGSTDPQDDTTCLDVEGCLMSPGIAANATARAVEIRKLLREPDSVIDILETGMHPSLDSEGRPSSARAERHQRISADFDREPSTALLAATVLRRLGSLPGTPGNVPQACPLRTPDPSARILSRETRYGRAFEIENSRGSLAAMEVAGLPHRPTIICLHGRRGYRIGPNRILAELGPALCGSEINTLRFDFAGWGDSAGRGIDFTKPSTEQQVDEMVSDVQSVVGHLRRERPESPLILLGFCLGGYTALRSVLGPAAISVEGMILVSPYFAGIESDARSRARGGALALREYLGKLRQHQTWQRLLTGKVDPRGALQVSLARLLPSRREVPTAWPSSPGSSFPSLRLYAEHDATRIAAETLIAERLDSVSTPAAIQVVPRTDVNFGTPLGRSELFQHIADWLAKFNDSRKLVGRTDSPIGLQGATGQDPTSFQALAVGSRASSATRLCWSIGIGGYAMTP